jgi:hypothetical protein
MLIGDHETVFEPSQFAGLYLALKSNGVNWFALRAFENVDQRIDD